MKLPTIKLGRFRLRAMAGTKAAGFRWRLEHYPEGDGGSRKDIPFMRVRGERLTIAQAEQRTHELIASGAWSVPSPASVRTLRDLLELWMGAQSSRAIAERTLKLYRWHAKRLVAELGTLTPTHCTLLRLERYCDENLRQLSARTVAQDLKILALAWRWGERHELLKGTLRTPGVTMPAEDPDNCRPEQLAVLLKHLPARYRAILSLQAATGCRIGELLSLTWPAVQRGPNGWIVVSGKTGTRRVPSSASAVAAIELASTSSSQAEPYVFPFGYTALHQAINRAAMKAGLKPVQTHRIRGMTIDAAAEAGIDVKTAATIFGHSVEVMLRRYRRPTYQDRANAVRRADLGRLEDDKPDETDETE